MTEWRTLDLAIPEDHPSAAGHFPGNPIVPGALLLDTVLEAVADGCPVTIRAAKFLHPVRFGMRLKLRWQEAAGNLIRFECLLGAEAVLTGSMAYQP